MCLIPFNPFDKYDSQYLSSFLTSSTILIKILKKNEIKAFMYKYILCLSYISRIIIKFYLNVYKFRKINHKYKKHV